jgi:ribosomal protein S18 acetylase RimI-like enzyme
MAPALPPEPAHPDELTRAFQLLFQHLGGLEHATRVAGALELVEQGQLDPQGVFVHREGRQLTGVLLCLPLPGGMGLVWPPQVALGPDPKQREDHLLRHGCAWLRGQGVKVAQALLAAEDVSLGEPLLRHGFCHVTHLWYLRHDLSIPLDWLTTPSRLHFATYAEADPALFRRILLHTYEDTLDCPEVNGLRTIEEIIRGHQSQGQYDPRRWWLALAAGKPIGVLIATDLPEAGGWDLSYLGVVPEARRQGFGREMLLQVLCEARAAHAARVSLCVDGRNGPARRLYRAAGFEPFDRREVLLALWPQT